MAKQLFLNSSESAYPILEVKNTNADANPGEIKFVKDSSSPNTSDILGKLTFYGDDDAGNSTHFGSILVNPSTISNTSGESGTIDLQVSNVTTQTSGLKIIGGSGGTAANMEVSILNASNKGTFTVNSSNKFSVVAQSGNTTIGGTLGVTGLSSLTTLNVSGATGIDGDFDINTNKFIVASTSGNTTIAGTLNAAGATTLTSTLNAGATTLTSTLNVSGATNINGNFDIATNKFTVASASGDTTIAGTLGVTGLSSLTTLNVSGVTGIDGNFDIANDKFTIKAATGNTTVGGTLGVTGASTLSNTLAINTTSGSSLTITDNSTSTNAIATCLILRTLSSNTAAAGIGSGLNFDFENGVGSTVIGGSLVCKSTSVVSTSESSDLILKTITSGTLTDKLRIQNNGALEIGVGTTDASVTSGNNTGGVLFVKTNDSKKLYYKAAGGSAVDLTAGSDTVSSINDLTDAYVDSTSSNKNLIVGHAGTSISTQNSGNDADYNVALGLTSLDALTTGDNNTAIGYDSLTSAITSIGNTAVGYESGNSITGNNNTTIGSQAGASATIETGTSQSVSGTTNIKLAATSNTNDDYYNGMTIEVQEVDTSEGNGTISATISDYVGGSTLVATLTSIELSGSSATVSSSTGLDSKAYTIKTVGIISGIQNVIIGDSAGVTSATATNCVAIGYRAHTIANNSVSLGNSSITSLRCATSQIHTFSDQRDKTNIVDSTLGLSFINSITPREFQWNFRELYPSDVNNPKNGRKEIGFIAQELQSVMANDENEKLHLVDETNSNRLEVGYSALIPVLVKAVQELSAQNQALTDRITALENA